MKPIIEWARDWEVGLDTSREKEVSEALVNIFTEYWTEESIADKSKSTKNRNRSALHALGGHIVEEVVTHSNIETDAMRLVLEYIGSDGGPLVYQNEESWQKELDVVCRKLYKYLQRKC